MKTQWVHLTPRTRPGLYPFRNREVAAVFWKRMRRRFDSRVLAACLMSNHFHVVYETARPREFARELACELRAFTRAEFPGQNLWEPLRKIEVADDRQKLEILLRYVHLNPCRARIIDDPWLWEFSTLLDHGGKAPVPWIDRERLEKAVGLGLRDWERRHANFIALDPYVARDLLERLPDLPDLASLSEAELERAVEWVSGAPGGGLATRGPARDFWIRARMALAPERPLAHWVKTLGVAPTRARRLSLEPPTADELRGVASAARALRHGKPAP